ncbi:metalloaminopeptidase [Saccharomycopsis crataegensis]|uniref:Metalloaminopeptidase n=1 Tax=Saccharomycopsis crataegensis TaxID=43959 RepID=A0AAV5QEL0_9ASCO|nr:metalloaminopeptidase [Saccharomycopsis crataegensis]
MSSQETVELLRKLIDTFEVTQTCEQMVNGKKVVPLYNNRHHLSQRSKVFKRKTLPTTSNGYESPATPSSDEDEDDFEPLTKPVFHAGESCYTYYSQEYIDFTFENPTIYHVVKHFSQLLESHGFKYLPEGKSWGQMTPGFYYTTRNQTSLSCFVIGKHWTPEDGVGLIGAHIDVLTAKLKPSSKKKEVEGYELLGVAPYAGAISEVWWDRDLHIGGYVLVRDADGKIVSKLVKSDFPVARIPSLAPHFGKDFSSLLNKETRAVPVIAYHGGVDSEPEPELSDDEKKCPLISVHSITLLRFIAELAGVKVSELVQLDLDIYEGQKGAIGGMKKDFLFAPRVDDRICGFAAVYGLLEFLQTQDFQIPDHSFSLVTLYDNEEIGSLSKQGAQGGLSESVIERTIDSFIADKQGLSLESLYKVAYANTLILSADVNHAFNPNFPDVYLENHGPKLNTGMTIAFDERAMATDVTGRAIIEEVARSNGDKLQMFHIRNDSRSGGTIGPYISSKTGARTIDCGIAQWSMHSSRATVGSKDVAIGVKFFSGFFKYWRAAASKFEDF